MKSFCIMCQEKNKHYLQSPCQEESRGYDNLVFRNGVGKLHFPNGFTLVVHKDEYGNLSHIIIQDAPFEYKNADYAQCMFPELEQLWSELLRKAEVSLINEVIRKVQDLSEGDWVEFHKR